ncbi:Serine protease lint [Gryllus bimaculatus]|nr:Serine protease lint [Gryllus bimaculatus]
MYLIGQDEYRLFFSLQASGGSPGSWEKAYAGRHPFLLFQADPAGAAPSRNLFGAFSRPASYGPPQLQYCSCSCGVANEARIVGGQETDEHEFPWMVRLSYFNRFYCGGTLINDRYVLTAAHCVKGFMWFMIKVTFGEHDRCVTGAKPESRFVLRAIVGDFSFMNFDNDIALLRLNDRVPISEHDAYVGANATASGWGTLREDGKPSCTLQAVQVPVMSNEDCRATKYNEKMISDNMLCAGYPEGMKDSCQGDSGGPLATQREDNRFEQIVVELYATRTSVVLELMQYLKQTIGADRERCDMLVRKNLDLDNYVLCRGVTGVPDQGTRACTHESLATSTGFWRTARKAASAQTRNRNFCFGACEEDKTQGSQLREFGKDTFDPSESL